MAQQLPRQPLPATRSPSWFRAGRVTAYDTTPKGPCVILLVMSPYSTIPKAATRLPTSDMARAHSDSFEEVRLCQFPMAPSWPKFFRHLVS
jgi:hypothetical protein